MQFISPNYLFISHLDDFVLSFNYSPFYLPVFLQFILQLSSKYPPIIPQISSNKLSDFVSDSTAIVWRPKSPNELTLWGYKLK